MAVDDDPHRRAMVEPRQATGKLGIVRDGGAGTDHDRVMAGAQRVRTLTRRRSADPLAFAARRGDAAIERSGEFEGDQRTPEPQAAQETGIDLCRLLGTEPDLDVETGSAQPAQPLAGHARIGILERNDYSPDAGGDQRIDTGWGTTPMTAGFEADIGGCSASGLPRPAQRLGLAMRSPAGLGPTPSGDAPLFDDDAANGRVRPDGTEPATGKRQGRAHRTEIAGRSWRRAGL